jgi:hypothetical protein
MKAPSAEKLLEIVRQYYSADPKYVNSLDPSPEWKRFGKLRQRAFDSTHDRWSHKVVREVRRELPGYVVGDFTGPDPSFMVSAYADPIRPKGESVVIGHLSILAPVYTVYAVRYGSAGRDRLDAKVYYDDLPQELRAAAEVIAQKIEAEFEAPWLPPSVARTPVPLYIADYGLGEATLFHALFTFQPDNVPY